MQAFDGPVLFAVSPYQLSYVLKSVTFNGPPQVDRVIKGDTSLERDKWRYIYETGRLAWDKTEIDLEKRTRLLRSDYEDLDMFYPRSDALDADPRTEPDGEGAVGSRSGSQSTEPTMSVKQGKMKAIAVEEEASLPGLGEELEVEPVSDSGRLNIKIGDISNEVSARPSREDEELTKAQEPLISAMQDQTSLEAFQKTNQLDSLDAIRATLQKGAYEDRQNGIKLDTVKYKLANDMIPLATSEEDLIRRKQGDSITNEKSQFAAKLAASERNFTTHRHYLFQRFAKVAADARKENYGEVLNSKVRALRDQGASKHQIENYLMDQLLCDGRDKSLGVPDSLEDEGIQAVMNLVDNIELQKDFADQDNSNPKKPAGLEDLARTLDLDCQKHVADLVYIASKYNSNIHVRRMSHVTNQRDEDFQEAMSVNQQHVLMKVMETINQNFWVASDLLHRTFWVPEAAIALWYDGKPPDVIIPTDLGSGEDPPESIYKSPTKRSYVAEAGPSSSTKKLRTGSPEEDTEGARAPFERATMATTDVTEKDSAADVPRQKSDEMIENNLQNPPVSNNSFAPASSSRNNNQSPQNGSNNEGRRAGTDASSGIA